MSTLPAPIADMEQDHSSSMAPPPLTTAHRNCVHDAACTTYDLAAVGAQLAGTSCDGLLWAATNETEGVRRGKTTAAARATAATREGRV
jgi:hypothetical protein